MLTTRKLGTRGLTTSALGLGCMGMSQSYGTSEERDERESIATAEQVIADLKAQIDAHRDLSTSLAFDAEPAVRAR